MAEGVLAEIAARKRTDVAQRLAGASHDPQPTQRSLRAALGKPGARFLMEVKKASPSGHRSGFSVEEAVTAYAPVADAISVLTDAPYFNGSLDDLRTVRARFDGPILAKDFIVDPRQVAEARLHGADAVLVILAMLDDSEAAAIMAEAQRFGMDVIVEVHDEVELDRALALGAEIVGINNRDLRTLKTDLAVTERLVERVPADRLVISESGIRDRSDVERLAPSVDAFLVGSSLMASDDIGQAARALVHGRVKICGLTRVEDASLAASSGATHAGLIFAEGSKRRVGSNASAIADAARSSGAKTVGVFQDQDCGLRRGHGERPRSRRGSVARQRDRTGQVEDRATRKLRDLGGFSCRRRSDARTSGCRSNPLRHAKGRSNRRDGRDVRLVPFERPARTVGCVHRRWAQPFERPRCAEGGKLRRRRKLGRGVRAGNQGRKQGG